MSKVNIKNVYMNYHSIYSETPALKNINLKIKNNEFISIVGPSGCGKSTLLNIISGLVEPSSGEILINNKLNKGVSSKIGYMFQKDDLFEWLSVWKNILIGLKIQHKINTTNLEKITKLLHTYNLYEFKDYYPYELSGGMRQRVALIRTLSTNPEVLLLDEPFSALDYQSRLKASNDIYSIIKNENKTAVMVTHDIAEAISMSDRIAILSKRPAFVKKIITITFASQYDTPFKRREAPNFRKYFNTIWEEIDVDGTSNSK